MLRDDLLKQVPHETTQQIELVGGHGKRPGAIGRLRHGPFNGREICTRAKGRSLRGLEPQRYRRGTTGHDADELECAFRNDGADDDFHQWPFGVAAADRAPVDAAFVACGSAELDALYDLSGSRQ